MDYGVGSDTDLKMTDDKPADAKRGVKSERLSKWCLKCHWSRHNTSECNGSDGDTEAVVAELYWGKYERQVHISLLWKQPNDVYELMDQLTTHQHSFLKMERFFADRDNLLQQVLEDGEFLVGLQPTLGDNETATSIYESLLNMANCATKAFVVSVVQAIFVIFKAVVVGKRSRSTGETNLQFRARMARMVFESQSAQEFPLSDKILETFKSSLDFAWQVYVGRMENLEKEYLERYFSKQVLSTGQQRIVRLPTSYLRLRTMTEFEGKALIWPVFYPFDLSSLEEYQADDVGDPLDDLYQPPVEIITGTSTVNNEELTNVAMPPELGFLNLGNDEQVDSAIANAEDTQGPKNDVV